MGSAYKKMRKTFLDARVTNKCPKCHVNFKKGAFHVLWHDVLECNECGHIWVAASYSEALRWL